MTSQFEGENKGSKRRANSRRGRFLDETGRSPNIVARGEQEGNRVGK
jgi:hypothetical protein